MSEEGRKVNGTRTNSGHGEAPERRQSLLGKFTKTVQAVIAPSWLSDFIGSVNKKVTPEKQNEEEKNIHKDLPCQNQMPTSFQGLSKKPTLADLSGPLPPLHFTNGLHDSHHQQIDPELGLANSKLDMDEPLSKIPFLKSSDFSSESDSQKLSESDWCTPNNSPTERNTSGFNVSLFESHFDRKSPGLFDNFHNSSHYVGKIKYGGAMRQQRRENVNVYPIRRKMKARPVKSSDNSGSSAAAKRILESLEKISKEMSGSGPVKYPDVTFRREYQVDTPMMSISRKEHRIVTPKVNTQRKENLVETPRITATSRPTTTYSQAFSSGGKIKEKKFQKHAPKRNQDANELFEVQELRTDFVLPMTSMPTFESQQPTSDKKWNSPVSKSNDEKSQLTYSFSSPIQASESIPSYKKLSNSNVDFQFSSPLGADGSCDFTDGKSSNSHSTIHMFSKS